MAALLAVTLAPVVESVEPNAGALRYVGGFVFAVLLYLSILLHEMSHAVMARHLGMPVRSITLEFLGGFTELGGEPPTPGAEFKIAVVGPITSLAVGGVALAASLALDPGGLTGVALSGLAGANIVLGILNLVPGLPLDGGRVLRAAVWQARGNMHTGTIVAGWGGRIAAVALLGWPFLNAARRNESPSTLDIILAAVVATFLWTGASASMTNARIRRRLPAIQARRLARRVAIVPADLPISEAVRRAQQDQAGGVVTVDGHNQPVGVVSESALAAVPELRRPWAPISSVSRTLSPGLMLPADSAGETLIRAMSRTQASEYLLVEPDGSVYGLLATADVDAAFRATD